MIENDECRCYGFGWLTSECVTIRTRKRTSLYSHTVAMFLYHQKMMFYPVIYLFVYLFVYLYVCLSIYVSIFLAI